MERDYKFLLLSIIKILKIFIYINKKRNNYKTTTVILIINSCWRKEISKKKEREKKLRYPFSVSLLIKITGNTRKLLSINETLNPLIKEESTHPREITLNLSLCRTEEAEKRREKRRRKKERLIKIPEDLLPAIIESPWGKFNFPVLFPVVPRSTLDRESLWQNVFI